MEEYSISAYRWSKALEKNKKLIHIDLSFNNFKAPDIHKMGKFRLRSNNGIGESFKSNHTILGIHMMGNDAKVDELGFMQSDGY